VRSGEAGVFDDIDRELHRPFDRYVDEQLAAFVHARAGRRALARRHRCI
jgi:hypothetical protein